MSKHKDGAAHTLIQQQQQPHQQLQPRLRKTTARSAALAQQEDAFQMPQLRNKRKAPDSPNKMLDKAVVKRSALGNMTNAVPNAGVAAKKVLQQIDNLKLDNKVAKVSE